MSEARSFALRSLDRILSEAWNPERGLLHVIAYSEQDSRRRESRDPARRQVAGLLDDYAFTALACFEAYESTADLSYFRFGKSIADFMIAHFYDQQGGGFFDMASDDGATAIGALTARRKPFQDSPTPAGDSAAAIAMLRLYSLTNENRYRELATKTLEISPAWPSSSASMPALTVLPRSGWRALHASRAGGRRSCCRCAACRRSQTVCGQQDVHSRHRGGGRCRLSSASARRFRTASGWHCKGTADGAGVQQFHLSASGQRSRRADEINLWLYSTEGDWRC